jgi:hypothetical protein
MPGLIYLPSKAMHQSRTVRRLGCQPRTQPLSPQGEASYVNEPEPWQRRVALAVAGICFLLWGLTACAQPPQDQGPPPIVAADDLVDALRRSGAKAERTPSTDGPSLEVPAQVITVDGVDILVYEYASEQDRQAVAGSISVDAATIGGRPVAWPSPPKLWAAGRLIVAYAGTDGGTVLLLNSLLGDPIRSGETLLGEPYPPAVTAAIEALASRVSVDPASVEVMSFDSVNWPDACLDLPQAGEACAQAVTPGWRIDLLANGTAYEAHTDQLGSQVRIK